MQDIKLAGGRRTGNLSKIFNWQAKEYRKSQQDIKLARERSTGNLSKIFNCFFFERIRRVPNFRKGGWCVKKFKIAITSFFLASEP